MSRRTCTERSVWDALSDTNGGLGNQDDVARALRRYTSLAAAGNLDSTQGACNVGHGAHSELWRGNQAVQWPLQPKTHAMQHAYKPPDAVHMTHRKQKKYPRIFFCRDVPWSAWLLLSSVQVRRPFVDKGCALAETQLYRLSSSVLRRDVSSDVKGGTSWAQQQAQLMKSQINVYTGKPTWQPCKKLDRLEVLAGLCCFVLDTQALKLHIRACSEDMIPKVTRSIFCKLKGK